MLLPGFGRVGPVSQYDGMELARVYQTCYCLRVPVLSLVCSYQVTCGLRHVKFWALEEGRLVAHTSLWSYALPTRSPEGRASEPYRRGGFPLLSPYAPAAPSPVLNERIVLRPDIVLLALTQRICQYYHYAEYGTGAAITWLTCDRCYLARGWRGGRGPS
eukprot:2461482-Rhodomonas_salina.10